MPDPTIQHPVRSEIFIEPKRVRSYLTGLLSDKKARENVGLKKVDIIPFIRTISKLKPNQIPGLRLNAGGTLANLTTRTNISFGGTILPADWKGKSRRRPNDQNMWDITLPYGVSGDALQHELGHTLHIKSPSSERNVPASFEASLGRQLESEREAFTERSSRFGTPTPEFSGRPTKRDEPRGFPYRLTNPKELLAVDFEGSTGEAFSVSRPQRLTLSGDRPRFRNAPGRPEPKPLERPTGARLPRNTSADQITRMLLNQPGVLLPEMTPTLKRLLQ